MTFRQVADALDCSRSWVVELENGVRDPSLATLVELAHLYKVPLATWAKKIAEAYATHK